MRLRNAYRMRYIRAMDNTIPSAEQVREKLLALGHAQVRALAERAAVPFTTAWKIRSGETADPRLETVRQLWPELVGLDAEGAATEPAKA